MNTILWIVQILLAIMFLMAGGMKLMQPKEKIAERMAWANDFSQNNIRLIGVAEVLGAVGLILPWALNIVPVLTPLAGVGLALDMVGAAYTHYKRKEFPMIGMNTVLLLMALFVAYGRFNGA